MKIQKHDPDRPSRAWFSKRELAFVLDISQSAFDANWRRHVDDDAQRLVNGKLYFHARSVINNWLEDGPRIPRRCCPRCGQPIVTRIFTPADAGTTNAGMAGKE
jgi:hypothetical protein